MRIFINEKSWEVEEGSTAIAALRKCTPDLADKVDAGAAYVTDARAITLGEDTTLSPGDILRVVVSARRSAEAADAES